MLPIGGIATALQQRSLSAKSSSTRRLRWCDKKTSRPWKGHGVIGQPGLEHHVSGWHVGISGWCPVGRIGQQNDGECVLRNRR